MAYNFAGLDPEELSAGIQAILNKDATGELYGPPPPNAAPAAAQAPVTVPAPVTKSVGGAPDFVVQMPKGSGMKQSGELKKSEGHSDVNRRMQLPHGEDLKDLQALTKVIMDSPQIAFQRAGIMAEREALADQIRAQLGKGADHTPALSYLANYYTHGQAPIVAPEKSPKQTLMDYALKIQDDQRDLAKSVNDYIKNMRGGYTQTGNTGGTTNIYTAKSGEFGNDAKAAQNSANNWKAWTRQTDSNLKPLLGTQEELGRLSDMINSNNPTAQREIPITLTKAMVGSARIAIQEIALGKGDPGLGARLEQTWNNMFHENDDGSAGALLTAENAAQYKQFAKMLRQANQQNIEDKKATAHIAAAGYQTSDPGFPMDKAEEYLGSMGKAREPQTPETPTKRARTAAEEAEMQAILKKAAGGAGGK